MRNLGIEEEGLLSNKDEPQDRKRKQESVIFLGYCQEEWEG